MNTKFQPALIKTLENLLSSCLIKEEHIFKHKYAIRKNIAYNLQYLEYLAFNLKDENKSLLTDVIRTMTIRNFVITEMGVVEGILYYILVTNNFHKKKKEEPITKLVKTKFTTLEGKREFYTYTQVFKILAEDKQYPDEMNLDSMLKRAEKNKILGEATVIYKILNHLRKLRNTVHIHLIEERLDTHYNKFNESKFQLMKKILYHLLKNIGLLNDTSSQDIFWYLKTNESTEK